KAFIKHCPSMMEEVFETGSYVPIRSFLSMSQDEMLAILAHETITSEFGRFTAFWHRSDETVEQVYLPKYYDVTISGELRSLERHCDLRSVRDLRRDRVIEYQTGDEIGKMAYGS